MSNKENHDYAPYILEMLRQRSRLKEDDKRMDGHFNEMSPRAVVRECTAWKLGDPAWADYVVRLMGKCTRLV